MGIIEEIRKTEAYKEEKEEIKRHGGFNLVGKYRKTDEEIRRYLIEAIEQAEIYLVALTDMLAQEDFH